MGCFRARPIPALSCSTQMARAGTCEKCDVKVELERQRVPGHLSACPYLPIPHLPTLIRRSHGFRRSPCPPLGEALLRGCLLQGGVGGRGRLAGPLLLPSRSWRYSFRRPLGRASPRPLQRCSKAPSSRRKGGAAHLLSHRPRPEGTFDQPDRART